MTEAVTSVAASRDFGDLPYDPASVFTFPAGLPGFEQRRRFIPVHLPESEPLVFLQNLEDPALCFVTLPMAAVDRNYRLTMTEEDRESIGLPPSLGGAAGKHVLCLAVVSLRETGPTANLLAPVVINLRNRLAVQAIAPASNYSCQHPLLPDSEAPAETASCS
jgi:flagellar assembly factor FliW